MVNIAFVVVLFSNVIRIAYGGDLGLGGIAAKINCATGDLVPNVVSLTEGKIRNTYQFAYKPRNCFIFL